MMVFAAILHDEGRKRPCAVLGGDVSVPGNVIVLVEAGHLRLISVAMVHVEVLRVHPPVVWHPVEALAVAEKRLAEDEA